MIGLRKKSLARLRTATKRFLRTVVVFWEMSYRTFFVDSARELAQKSRRTR